MSIADITSRLYSSAAYRNVPVSKALVDAVKMNLKFRFSLVGMAAAITGSQTLYQVAQQKYLISEEERKQQTEEITFKKYVISSISALSRQVALLESVAEKNNLMLNMVMDDLGYFKAQRKYTQSYASMKSFRAPLPSKTVKGRIEEINAQIQALKGIRTEQLTAKERQAAKELKKKEQDKNRGLIAAAAAATLSTLGLTAAGVGAGAAAALGGVVGAGAAALTSVAAQQLIGRAIPIVGKAFKVSLLFGVGMGVIERAKRREKTGVGVQTGDPEDYVNNIDPKLDPVGFKVRQEQIEFRRSLDNLLEQIMRPVDTLLAGISAFLAAKYGAEFYDVVKGKAGRGGGRVPRGRGTRRIFDVLRGAATTPGIVGAAGAGVLGAGKSAAATASKVVRKLPRKMRLVLGKLSRSRFLRSNIIRGGALGAGFAAFTISDMITTASDFERGAITPEEYELRMTENIRELVSTVGIGGLSAVLGGLVGGPIGLVAGGLAGVAAGFLLDDATTTIASALFKLFNSDTIETGGGETPVGVDGRTTTTGPASTIRSIRNNNPGNLKFANQRGATGKDADGFAIFSTPEAGMEAMRRQIILDTQNRQMTLTQFVNKYAPASENDTTNYIKFLSQQTGLSPQDKVPYDMIPTLQTAMIMMEGGPDARNYFVSATLAGGGAAAATMSAFDRDRVQEAQIIEFFMKNSGRVDTLTETPEETADGRIEQQGMVIAAGVNQLSAQLNSKIDKIAIQTQRQYDIKDLERIAYVDDNNFDFAFKTPDFSAQ